MKILLTGGTGLIGRAVCGALMERRHSLTVFSRRPDSVAEKCGAAARAIGSLDEWRPGDHYDAVINLAGEPIAGARWSDKRKKILWNSRVSLTAALLEKIFRAKSKPDVLLSGSAVGIYGDCGDRAIDESGAAAADFGARLCDAWEQEARKAEACNVRTCLLRTGLVLSREGGILRQLAAPFKLGLGARIGGGKQWMSWIHIADQVAVMLALLDEPRHRGAFNLCAPNPVTNAAFTRRLGSAVNRPALLAASGYRFRYPELDGALDDLM